MAEKRKHYRKTLRVTGQLLLEDREVSFSVYDFSTAGIRASFKSDPGLAANQQLKLRLPALKLEAYATLRWMKPNSEGGVNVGMKFEVVDGVDGNTYRYRSWEE